MKDFLVEPMDFTYQLEESSVANSGNIKLKGLFQKAEARNGNGRIYPKAILEREIAKIKPSVMERRVMGEIDHPIDPKIHLDKVSHLITNLHCEGNEVYGELEILQTPAGKLLEGLVKSGVKLGISSRGTGSLREDKDLGSVVQEDFNLITWDIVGDPSTIGAWVSITESLNVGENFQDAAKIIKREKALHDALHYAACEILKV